ncbi:MAG: aminotransferase class I/II-fold pyridoxal phosphate-dependent enzyme [Alphaproteobacteria bacterium]|nr:aminotransferase class I/II-fold pyridoxal phosphate-dependent enzyme [Alphaproteobacteria bacterium]
MASHPNIPFIDLAAQRRAMGDRLDAAIARVVDGGRYIFGPEVDELEGLLARHAGARRALTCANGTDALALPLMAWRLRQGDAVFCPSFTFCATAEVVPWLGAECVFVDVDERTFNMDADNLDAAIAATIAEGRLTPRAIIAVDLFGLPADYDAIAAVARKYELKLIADSAQSFGSRWRGRPPSDYADAMTTSFYPAKPLGCYGDGGAILTNDDDLAEHIVSLRNHGQPMPGDEPPKGIETEPKYLNMRIGMNSRLDTLQAAILIEKMRLFPGELDARDAAAARYRNLLEGSGVIAPTMPDDGTRCVWAQYTVRLPQAAGDRDAVVARLKAAGVPIAVYYPVPMHLNAPYRRFGTAPGGLPRTERLAREVFSIPMHGYLEEATQVVIVDAIRQAMR